MTTSEDRPSLWEEILWERAQQDVEHGGPDADDLLAFADWVSILCQFAGRAYSCARLGRGDLYRARLIQVAAVAVAAIESHDRLSPGGPVRPGHLRAGPDAIPPAGQVEAVVEAKRPEPPAAPECLT